MTNLRLSQVMEMDEVARRFQRVTAELVQALDFLPYDLLDVSDEVREQVSFPSCQRLRDKSGRGGLFASTHHPICFRV